MMEVDLHNVINHPHTYTVWTFKRVCIKERVPSLAESGALPQSEPKLQNTVQNEKKEVSISVFDVTSVKSFASVLGEIQFVSRFSQHGNSYLSNNTCGDGLYCCLFFSLERGVLRSQEGGCRLCI